MFAIFKNPLEPKRETIKTHTVHNLEMIALAMNEQYCQQGVACVEK